jgi:hypothetical protein|tara:strand:- start:538 stop:744 length:207 start_codon:yes stop_codon:yes gene_type:complete
MVTPDDFRKRYLDEERRRKSQHDLAVKVKNNHYALQEKRGPQFAITDQCEEPHKKDNRERLARSKDPK